MLTVRNARPTAAPANRESFRQALTCAIGRRAG